MNPVTHPVTAPTKPVLTIVAGNLPFEGGNLHLSLDASAALCSALRWQTKEKPELDKALIFLEMVVHYEESRARLRGDAGKVETNDDPAIPAVDPSF